MFKMLATVENVAKRGGPTFVEESVMSVYNIEKARLLLMTQAALLIRMKSPAAAVTIPIIPTSTRPFFSHNHVYIIPQCQ